MVMNASLRKQLKKGRVGRGGVEGSYSFILEDPVGKNKELGVSSLGSRLLDFNSVRNHLSVFWQDT